MAVTHEIRKWLIAGALLVACSWFGWLLKPGEGGHANASGMLAGRENLVVCVDNADSGQDALTAQVDRVSSVLADLYEDARWKEFELGDSRASVESGCPDGFVPPTDDVGRRYGVVGRGAVKVVLPERLLVFAAPKGSPALGDRGWGRAAYEFVCEDHECWEVTTALYVDEGLWDTDVLSLGIESALGFRTPGLEDYPLGHDPAKTQSKAGGD